MNVETIGATDFSPPRSNDPAQQVDRTRATATQQTQNSEQQNKVQPEELLSQIKSLTQDGLYSVRFEKDSGTNEMVVKVVDSKTDKVIRQIPPQEILDLSKRLDELNGNIINKFS